LVAASTSFQFVANDAFDLAVKLQQYRQVKAFGVTYIANLRPWVLRSEERHGTV
jgi:hypothetical protein